MLKKEVLDIKPQPKPKVYAVCFQVPKELHDEIKKAATELGCSISEYFRRLHWFAQDS